MIWLIVFSVISLILIIAGFVIFYKGKNKNIKNVGIYTMLVGQILAAIIAIINCVYLIQNIID